MSHTTKENVYCQAAFTQEVWSLAVKVKDAYEEGKLKQHKLSQRNLLTTPDFKQHYFLPLHYLELSFQEACLQLVVDRQLSLSEMKEWCNKHQALSTVKSSFVRCTGTRNWEEAVRRFEAFADEDRLAQLIHLNFRKQIPEPFRDFCQAAVNSENPTAVDCYTVIKECTSGYILQDDPTDPTATKIKEAISCYTGANLIIAHIPSIYSYSHLSFYHFSLQKKPVWSIINLDTTCDVIEWEIVLLAFRGQLSQMLLTKWLLGGLSI